MEALKIDFANSTKGNVKVVNGKKPEQKLTKDGRPKQTPNNTKENREKVCPFKEEDIVKMNEYLDMRILCAQDEEKREIAVRNKYLFIMGCNSGLRVSDLCSLKWNDVIDEHGNLREEKSIKPKKTSNINKHITQEYNLAFRKAALSYIKENKISVNIDRLKEIDKLEKKLSVKIRTKATMIKSIKKTDKYSEEDLKILTFEIEGLQRECDDLAEKMFVFSSREGGHIQDGVIRKFINDGAKACGIKYNVSTHSMRKTFARVQYDHAENKTNVLHRIMEMFGHSSEWITLRYIGVTQEEIKEQVNNCNIGMEITDADAEMINNFKL